jgi:hypothetical protein
MEMSQPMKARRRAFPTRVDELAADLFLATLLPVPAFLARM